MTFATTRPMSRHEEESTVIEAETDVQTVLDGLHDADCQTILSVTSDEALSAKQVSKRCDLPLSTTYRKLQILTETGLLEKRTRIRRSGKHTNEYVRSVENVIVSIDADGELALKLFQRDDVLHIAPDGSGE